MAPAWGRKKGLKSPRRTSFCCSQFCPQSSKRPKRSSAGCRHADHWRKTTFGQEIEREQKHTTGQKPKQPGEEISCLLFKYSKKKDLSSWDAVAAYQENCEDRLASSPLIGHQWLEKKTSRTRLITSCTAAAHSTRTVCRFNLIPPSLKQELKSCNVPLLCGMWTHRVDVAKSRSWNVKWLQKNLGHVLQVQWLYSAFKLEWRQNHQWSKM